MNTSTLDWHPADGQVIHPFQESSGVSMQSGSWKSFVLGGCSLIAGALLAFAYCSYCEGQGKLPPPSSLVLRVLLVLYLMIGKWGILATGISGGVLMIAMGYTDRRRERKYFTLATKNKYATPVTKKEAGSNPVRGEGASHQQVLPEGGKYAMESTAPPVVRKVRGLTGTSKYKEEFDVTDEEGRTFTFDCGWGVYPYVAYVPSTSDWRRCVPRWLHQRRDEVIAVMEAENHSVKDGHYYDYRGHDA